MGRLILVRHGESEGNRQRVFATHTHKLPLTELGYQQARAAAKAIARLFQVKLVISSPYVRASETARVVAEVHQLPMQIEPKLHERDVGAFQGESYESLRTAPGYDPTRPWLWKPKGGESLEDVKERVGPILDRLAQQHAGSDVAVVSHGGVMMALWAHVTGEWASARIPPNCGLMVIEHGPDGYASPQVLGGGGLVSP